MSSGQHPDTAGFLKQLMRFQRRLAVVAFVRHVPAAAGVAIVATEAVVIAAHPTTGYGALWFAGCAALALTIAGIIALAQTRSLSRTATTLDKRFRLDDRAVTALEFARNSDSMSRLIVTDASARLAAHGPRELSLESSFRLGWVSAGVLGASIAFGVAINRSPIPPEITTNQDSVAKTAQVSGRLNEPSRSSTAPRSAEAKAEGAAAASRRLPKESAIDLRQGESPLGERPRPTPEGSSEQSKSSENKSAAGSTATPDGRSGDRTDSGRPSATNTAVSGRRSDAGEARNDRGAGAGGGPALGAGTGAGGVKGTVRATTPRPPARKPADGASYAARFRRAWNHAESPLAQERVPAGLRAYVRDYFLAIRPDDEP